MKRGKEIKSKSAVSIAPLINLNCNNEDYIATEENAFNIILSGKKQDARCIKHVYRERLDKSIYIQKYKTSSCIWNKSILDNCFSSLYFPNSLCGKVMLPL